MKKIEISDIYLNKDFKEKYKVISNDFVCFSIDNTSIDEHLYRFGGFGRPNLNEVPCFLVLRHHPSKMSKDYIKKYNLNSKYPHYLKSNWIIMDIYGNTLKEFDSYESAYLKEGTYIYSVGSKYYNAKTGEYYGCGNSFESKDYIFIDNIYDYTNRSKEGIVRIDKKTGESLIYKK